MLETIILLTGAAHQQRALCALLAIHNPALSFRVALTLEDLAAIDRKVLRHARLVAFTSGTIVPASMLEALGHGAYNFHPGPPHYPGWAPAHFAIYDGAKIFGGTMHEMAPRVDSGPIVGVDYFGIPDNTGVRTLEEIAYIRLARLFWGKARNIACESGPLPRLPISWSGIKSTKKLYRDYCEIPADIGAAELRRRIRIFDDDFRGIPLTVTLHGIRFRLRRAESRARPGARQIDAPPLAALEHIPDIALIQTE
jgi:methionyl-tRNA formyltransferase